MYGINLDVIRIFLITFFILLDMSTLFIEEDFHFEILKFLKNCGLNCCSRGMKVYILLTKNGWYIGIRVFCLVF